MKKCFQKEKTSWLKLSREKKMLARCPGSSRRSLLGERREVPLGTVIVQQNWNVKSEWGMARNKGRGFRCVC